MVYREQLSKIYKDLKEQKSQLLKERAFLPEGYVNIRSYNNRNYYTWQIPKKGKQKKPFRKGITNNKDQINKLVRKRYLDGAIANIEDDILMMENVLKEIHYGNMTNEEWAADYRQVVGLYEEDLKSTSSSGRKMRSYGELLISSRLDFYGIPYRYEERIDHPGVNRVPDFTIRRPRDGKIFYWEHMGMVEDGVYLNDNIRKIKQYAAIGITPWDNLIITFGQADGGMDIRKIDAIIQGWLL